MAESKFVSLQQYADLCDVKLKTIKYRIGEGHLTTTKIEQFGTIIEVINTELYPPLRMRAKR